VINLSKEVATVINTANTSLNTLHTYEQTVLQVARLGDPAALRNLPGVSTVAELYQMYGQLSRNVETTQALLNPQRYQSDMNFILSGYNLPNWNGFQTSSGLPVLPGQGMFQFQTGTWNVANNAQQQLATLDQQRQRLQQQRDAALSSLQSATTASDVQKYTAVVQALNAGIAEVAQAEQELNHRTAYQTQQLQSGQQIFNTSQAQAQQAADYQTIDAGLNGLPMGSFRQPVYWNKQ
jgi:DNA integrity scanning protein DisA with diadenylate cyclase activity